MDADRYRYSVGAELCSTVMPTDPRDELFQWAQSLNGGVPCAGVLINEYPDAKTAAARGYGAGSSGVAAHSDDEHKSYLEGIIVSASLGATRRFVVRDKASGEKRTVLLSHADVVLMMTGAQEHFTHEIPKENASEKVASTGEFRYNLTFRPTCACGLPRCLKKHKKHKGKQRASQ